jgi:hypothetical protein
VQASGITQAAEGVHVSETFIVALAFGGVRVARKRLRSTCSCASATSLAVGSRARGGSHTVRQCLIYEDGGEVPSEFESFSGVGACEPVSRVISDSEALIDRVEMSKTVAMTFSYDLSL